MATKESLFSFEVAVQHLRINASTITCRFPALAIRLLDFPSLLIPHLEKSERDTIKEAVSFDTSTTVPNVLKELLDSRGNFKFEKGKSCMFKSDIDTLCESLHNVPLYITITEMWGDTPKLIGVSTVPMVELILDIRKDIDLRGISCPTMSGHQGIFPVFNLMGSEIGQVSLGCRLLSLGQSIMPHIPHAAIASIQMHPSKTDANDFGSNHQRLKPVTEHDAACPRYQGNDSDLHNKQLRRGEPNTSNSGSNGSAIAQGAPVANTEQSKDPEIEGDHRAVDQETQTHQRMNMKGKSGGAVETHSEHRMPFHESLSSEHFVTNTHCPPPLFFNANGVQQEPRRLLTNARKLDNYETPDVSCSDSSEPYHSKAIEVHYRLEDASPEYVRKTVKVPESSRISVPSTSFVETMGKGRYIDGCRPESTGENTQRGDPCVRRDQEKMSMPILTALLDELSVLTGVRSSHNHFPISVNDLSVGKENIEPFSERGVPSARRTPSPRSGDAISDELSAVHSHPGHKSCRHDGCAEPSRPVPSAKGWLRQEPKFAKKQSKLQFKMTYSQKLRLKKNNPELLKTMEMEEQRRLMKQNTSHTVPGTKGTTATRRTGGARQRKSESGAKRSQVSGGAKSSSSQPFDHCPPDVPTEVARHDSGEKVYTKDLPLPSRCPIPTPRRSLSTDVAVRVNLDTLSDPHDQEISFAKSSFLTNGDLSASEKSGTKSIEVFIPHPTLLESDSDGGGDLSESDESRGQSPDHHQVRQFGSDLVRSASLGTPVIRVESRESTNNPSNYSQDFESVGEGDSDKSQSPDDSQSSGSSYHTVRGDDLSSWASEKSDEQESLRARSAAPHSFRASNETIDPHHPLDSESIGSGASWSPNRNADDSKKAAKSQEGRKAGEKEGNFLTENDYLGDMPRKQISSKLSLPQPPLSSVSPVPQHRKTVGNKIVLCKPVRANIDEYNDSGEVNLPSDLSASFDDHRHQREVTPIMSGSPRSVPHDSGLDVVRSVLESKESIDEYSHDFESDE